MKVGFVLLEHYTVNQKPGSSLVRGRWIIKYWPEAFECPPKRLLKLEPDVLFFQKTASKKIARKFEGLKIYDRCDPKDYDEAMIKWCDVVTAPNELLIEEFKDQVPCYVMPDRHDMDTYKVTKTHRGSAEKVCWMGTNGNHALLKDWYPLCRKYNLELTVISNSPPKKRFYDKFVRWEEETYHREICKSDIYIDPRTHLWWKNDPSLSLKTQMAKLLNMPVANTPEELRTFARCSPKDRNVRDNLDLHAMDIRRSVEQLQAIIQEHKK